MRNSRLYAVLALLMLSGSAFSQEAGNSPKIAAAAQEPTMAAYVIGDVPDYMKKFFGTYLLSALMNYGANVNDETSAAFLAAVDEERAKRQNALNDGFLCELGRRFGIRYICAASITPVPGAFTLSARIMSVKTGKSRFNGETTGPLVAMEDLERATGVVVEKMFDGKGIFGEQTESEPIQAPETKQSATYVVTVNVNPPNGGDVYRIPNKVYYDAGEHLTLSVSANYGYTFMGWTGAVTGNEKTLLIDVDGNITLTANFRQTPRPDVSYSSDRSTYTYQASVYDATPSRPKHSLGMRVWGLGSDYPSPEAYFRIGLSEHSRAYVGFGWSSGSESDAMVAPYMTVNYDFDFDVYQFAGFLEWHAGNIASVYGGPGIILGSYGLKSTLIYNNEPLPIKISGPGIDFGLQGGAELKLWVFVFGVNTRIAYGLYSWEIEVNKKVSQRETVPALTYLLGLNFEIRF